MDWGGWGEVGRFWRGIGVSVVGFVLYRLMYLGLVDYFAAGNSWLKLYGVTTFSMLMVHPLEVVRRLGMMTGETSGEIFWKCVERPEVFFAGAFESVLRIILSTYGFMLYDKIKYYLTQLNNKDQ